MDENPAPAFPNLNGNQPVNPPSPAVPQTPPDPSTYFQPTQTDPVIPVQPEPVSTLPETPLTPSYLDPAPASVQPEPYPATPIQSESISQISEPTPISPTVTEPVTTEPTPPVAEIPTDTPSYLENTEPTAPPPPADTKTGSKSGSKVLILAIGFLLLGMTLAVVYLFFQNTNLKSQLAAQPTNQPLFTPPPQLDTPTPIPTAAPTPDVSSWKTYTSPAKSFSFMFPADFTTSTYSEGTYKGTQIIFHGPKQGQLTSQLADGVMFKTLLITPTEKTAKVTAEEGRVIDSNQPEGTKITISNIKTIKLGGKDAYQYSASGMGDVIVTYVDTSEGVLRIGAYYSEPQGITGDYVELINSILSTFKFSETTL